MENAEITKEYVQTIMNAKAQPPGALGHVQDVAVQLCVLKQTVEPQVNAAACIIFCGDHGVTKNPPESPSPYPRAVTELMFQTVSNGGAAISTMCRALNIPLTVIDVGIDSPDRLSPFRVALGTSDMTSGPAMSAHECEQALNTGRSVARRLILEDKVDLLCVGELGIGNSTAAAALVCSLTGCAVEEVAGRGTGLDDAGVLRKVALLKRALKTNAELIERGPMETLQAVGGLEIAAMCGAMIEAGSLRVPVIVDGFISGAAALCARRIAPKEAAHNLFCSHHSAEKGASILLKALDAEAPLHMNMRLGEGTGSVLYVSTLQCAAALVRDMATLQSVMARGANSPHKAP